MTENETITRALPLRVPQFLDGLRVQLATADPGARLRADPSGFLQQLLASMTAQELHADCIAMLATLSAAVSSRHGDSSEDSAVDRLTADDLIRAALIARLNVFAAVPRLESDVD